MTGLRRTAGLVLCGALAFLLTAPGSAQAGNSHALIEGTGSSWSSNAVNQWIADVDSKGLKIVFTASGSAQGRKDFANKTNDFAVSDIGFAGTDQFGGADTAGGRAFAYLPVVAGGTSFPYQVKVGGKLKTNIRLSGQTLAKIFTRQIQNWNDQAITADNNGVQVVADLPIIPVVHSEGSGSTAQFTRYLDKQYPDIWRSFQGRAGLTEFYPSKSGMIAQNGSDGVINFINSGAANGAIGYDEYSYALAKSLPVVKLQNSAGYFTAPTQYNVAVALTKAVINQDKNSPDYLLQNLDAVYTATDPRAYAMSSYSYMIIPTAANDPRMTTAKRQTIADFLYYSTCEGQVDVGPIGYSPLPVNLAQASFDQVTKLKAADPGVDLSNRSVTTCHNPTFVAGQPTRNYLAEIAPQPPACDKAGAGPCTGGAGTANGNPQNGRPGGSAGASTGTSSDGSSSPSGTAHDVASQRLTAGTPQSSGGSGSTALSLDPATGDVVSGSASTTNGDQSSAANVPTTLAERSQSVGTGALGLLAGLLLVCLIIGPPLLTRWLASGARRVP